MRIRQVALVATDLDPVLSDLGSVFGLSVSLHDPGVEVFGLRNGVMPVGEHFLEVVSPKQEGTSAGRYLERRHGDGGYMVIFQTRDLASMKRRLQDHRVKTVWQIAFDDIETIHLHPRDTGGAIVSVDEARPWESWRWAGPDWRGHVRTGRVAAIAGVEIQGEDPARLLSHWREIFDLPDGPSPGSLALEDGGRIDFVQARDGRGEGIRSVLLRANDAVAIREAAARRGLAIEEDGAIRIAGTRFVLD